MHLQDRFRNEVKAYQGLVYTVAFGILLDVQETLDVVQETFVKAFEEPGFLDDGFNRKAWLARVARNLALNSRRSLIRRLKSLMRYAGLSWAAETVNVEEEIIRAETRQELAGVLDALDEDEREIIALRYAAELSYEEIAVELGIKIGTVMSRLSRAKRKIGMALEEGETS